MKTIKSLLLSLVATVFMVSCSDDPEGPSSTQYYGDCFHHVYNVMSGSYKIYDAPRYEFKFDYSDITVDIKIENVKFADAMPEISMSLEDLKWNMNNGFKVVSASNVIPKVDGVEMPDYTISSLKIEILDRYVGVYYEPVVNVCFVVNNVFKVTAVQNHILYMGETSVTNASSSAPFTTNTQIYQLTIDKDLTARLKITGAKFALGMPALDMVFKGIGVEINSGYGYALSSEKLIPEISDVPYPNYEIVNLSGNGTFASGLDLYFECNIKRISDSNEVIITPYAVNADLGFEILSE